MDKEITVIKRDGSHVPLDLAKFETVAKATGLSEEKAKEFAQLVRELVVKEAKSNDDTIHVQKIREIYHSELEKIDKYAANLYSWYEKTKK